MNFISSLVSRLKNKLWRKRPPLSPKALQGREYDRQTFAVFAKVLKRDSCCLDIGAHKGSILKEMIRLAPRGEHHAFEPLPYLAKRLRGKFRRVNVHEVAVADETGNASFCFVENAPAWSGLRLREYEFGQPVITPIEVKVARVDDLVSKDLRVALIKLDVEGGEYHALRGAADTIRRSRPYIVFEAEEPSTGKYGVSPEVLFDLIANDFGLQVSTMQRWLENQPPYSRREFHENWHRGREFYFLAYPESHSPS
jgi:FkbM family methyltransferase